MKRVNTYINSEIHFNSAFLILSEIEHYTTVIITPTSYLTGDGFHSQLRRMTPNYKVHYYKKNRLTLVHRCTIRYLIHCECTDRPAFTDS